MSFNYSSISSSGLPAMLPLLTNMTNGNGFISTLATSQALSTPRLMTAHHHTPLSDSPLEFNNSKSKTQAPGAGPMDLETLSDERETYSFMRSPTSSEPNYASGNNIQKASEHRRLEELANSSGDTKDKNSFSATGLRSSYNQCDQLMFNGVMGMPSQSLMMMPGVMNMMHDPSSMLSMQTMPQFSLLNHITSIQATSSSTNLVDPSSNTISTSSSSTPVAKETITCNSCLLLPPNPNAPSPTTRERPPGCRTVFVGGLPENITEDIIREIFERCGEITTLRLSKKNFCHIRFVYEASVDSAIYLSGYRIRVNSLTDSPNSGRLHVDYAQARDDQYEWECKQRQLQREQRHRERIERDRLRPLSPPPVIHFTDHEATSVSEKLKQDETFLKAVQMLITWLERGDCSKKNSNVFYSMIQSTNSHVRRLLNEKTTYEEEFQKAKELYRKQNQSLSVQLAQIEKVFGAASHKKVWDHFTKAQRKNIDLWKKQSLDIYVHTKSDETREVDEMEMSDDEEIDNLRYGKRPRIDYKDNESLKSEAMAYQNSAYNNNNNNSKTVIDLSNDVKNQQLKVLQETIRNLQTQLLDNKTKEKESLTKIADLENKLKQANVKELLLKTKIVEASKCSVSSTSARCSDVDESEQDVVCVDDDDDDNHDDGDNVENSGKVIEQGALTTPHLSIVSFNSSSGKHNTNQFRGIDIDEAQLISLVATFLVVHPFGASIDYIYSYVQRSSSQLRPKELEEILCRYTSVFHEEVTGVGAKIERKWKFCGFERNLNLTKKSVVYD